MLDVCSSFSPFQITVHSSNGTDLTSSIPILHSHIPLSTLQRRSHTFPILTCPSDAYIARSWCEHDVSASDFAGICTEQSQQQHTHINEGNCARDEICVGSNAEDTDAPRQAYCVSTNHFVRIGQDPSTGNGQTSGVVTASFNSALHNNGSQLAVEAVVTSLNRLSTLFATSVVIQAQAYNGVWRTVAEGQNYCKICSSVSLAPVPATAQRVKVDVVLPEWYPTGLLWLASYPY